MHTYNIQYRGLRMLANSVQFSRVIHHASTSEWTSQAGTGTSALARVHLHNRSLEDLRWDVLMIGYSEVQQVDN